MKPTLFLLMGLPGAGKTTAAKVIEEQTSAIRLSSDEQRIALWPKPTFSEEEHTKLYAYLNEQTKQLLTAGKSVIYDANLNRKIHRQEKYEIAKKLAIPTVLIVVRTPTELARKRSVTDGEGKENRVFGNLEEQVFERLKTEIEWPENDEPFIEINGTRITQGQVSEALGL